MGTCLELVTSTNGEHTVIRPLIGCREEDIVTYSEKKQFPIIPCSLCGSQENMQRQNIKQMLGEWEEKYPGRKESIYSALKNVVPTHLADTDLYKF